MAALAPRLSPSTILRYEKLEGVADRSLEDLCKLAAQLLDVERCFAGLLNANDGWLRTVVGVSAAEARDFSPFCAFVMLQSGPVFLEDARRADMLRHIPQVALDPGVRTLAGVQLVTSDGESRGAFVALDRKVRSLTDEQKKIFLMLANQVKNQIEMNTRLEELRTNHAAQLGALSMLKSVLRAATTFAVIGTDTSGRMTLWSEGAERLFGFTAAEAQSLTPVALLEPREVKMRAVQLSSALGRYVQGFNALVAECKTDAPVEQTWTMLHKRERPFPGLLVVARVVGEDGLLSGYAFIARDITEQRAVERMKDDFVSMVSHELRTPLTAIRGALGLARGGAVGVLPDNIAELVHIAHFNSDRLLHLVDDILDMNRLESGALDLNLEPTDVMSIVLRAVDLTRPVAAESNVTFVVRSDAKPASILADFERWVQIVVNLLSNAVKYSPAGGEVTIGVKPAMSLVRVTVSDQGPGIPDEFRERIFQKFSQAQTGNIRGRGTGLGLSIVKSLAELHGAKIGFESQAGEGATFWVEQTMIDPAG
ncbi:MAG: PAS domain-containing protein [Polyangiaceae bacterium]|nr:PAS domain-containing protein [Polyangiaceae bacterium]